MSCLCSYSCNVFSKGYLDIVRWLCEKGGAAEVVEVEGSGPVKGVDRKAKGGWTPLMNAASKGHLPVVLYLLTKQAANPLIRNDWGETAYDVAAAVFEIWICQVSDSFDKSRCGVDAYQRSFNAQSLNNGAIRTLTILLPFTRLCL